MAGFLEFGDFVDDKTGKILLEDWRLDDPQYLRKEEDDEDYKRVFHYIKHCPLPNCTAKSWKRVDCKSYDDEKLCLDKLKAHAMASSHHQLSEEAASQMIEDPEILENIEITEEDYQTRQRYREWADKEWASQVARLKEDRSAPPKGGKGGKSGKGKSEKGAGKSSSSRAAPAVINLDIQATVPWRSAGSAGSVALPAESHQAVKRRRENDDLVRIRWRQCELLRDSLRRARDSSLNSQALCQQLGAQFGQEARVVEVAYQCVEEILREASG
eukprot:TRINITY_DN936_c0_g2_i1.p1 TRINITY_DN936_c0_g2~~TRINITY_DN936_c0_g2_i1.p1  ORF type:complete len:296 (-),score=94.42 TRINITY_DN936_c0_g2_i1:151-966(-)